MTRNLSIPAKGPVATPGGSSALTPPDALISQLFQRSMDAQRDIKLVVTNITALATLDDVSANECLYALVRRRKRDNTEGDENDRENKAIEGPSIRLAEIAAQCYGNCLIRGSITKVDRIEKVVVAEAMFLDGETNAWQFATVTRRIFDKRGNLYSPDMIETTGRAAIAIAKRNAILSGIPRGIYRPAYMAAREMVAGTAQQLPVNRAKALAAFASYGVTPQQILDVMGVKSEGDLGREHIATLRGMYAAIKNEEATVEEMFPDSKTAEPAPSAAAEASRAEPTTAPADEAPPAPTQAAPAATKRRAPPPPPLAEAAE